jgi:CDGSH-type Zn-finger protein
MAKIKVCKNGPYLITDVPLNEDIVEFDEDNIPLKTKKGETFQTGKEYLLCRCGHSKNKPFCDNSHLQINFEGTENPGAKQKYLDQAETINGPGLEMKDNVGLCASAKFCHRAGGAWRLVEQSDNQKAKETAIEEACCCPSGRLVAMDKKSGKTIEPKLEKAIGIPEDGPLCVKGGIPVESSEGFEYEIRNRMTLCRCGKSKNKPFCDSSHLD